MKKLFYILTAAIVALGTVACENEGMDSITPENESLSFTATIDNSRTDLDENNMTVWDDDDVVTITYGEKTFSFTHEGDGVFRSTDEGVSALKGQSGLVAWYNEDGIDSWAGKDGAQLKAEGGEFAEDGTATGFDFVVQNAFVKFYASEGVKVTCTQFSDPDRTFDVEEAGTYYVAIKACEEGEKGTLSYTIGDETEPVKEVTMTFAAKKIYNLGNLIAAVAQDSNGKSYTDLASAVLLAESGSTITLGNDVVAEKAIEVPAGKEITIDLNGHNITTSDKYVLSNEQGGTVTINGNGGSMTGRIYNAGGTMVINGGTFNTIVGDAYTLMNSTDGKLTVEDATVNGGSGFYGICGYNANNEVILNNVNVTGTFGALCSYGVGAKMTVNGGTYEMTGIEGITSHIAYFSTESTIVINDGTFRKIGEVSLSGEGGGGICVTGGADLTINGGIFAGDYLDVYNWGGEGTTITIKGGNYKFNPTASFIADGYKVTENTDGTFTVAMTPVAALNKQIAEGASTITLTKNVVFEEGETLTIGSGKTVTLDLAGYTMSQEMTCTGSYVMVSNNGTLTIKDSAENGTIILTDNGDGDSTFGWGSYTVRNNGTLTIDGGTIKNVKRADVSHCAVPLMLYAGKATINDGNIISANYRTIQGFSTPEVIINGGNFEGQVWMHSTCSAEASLTIKGGTFAPRGGDGSSVFLNNDNDIKFAVTGGNFTTKVGCDDATKAGVVGAIKGGYFTDAAKTGGATATLVANGYKMVANDDETYTWMVREWNPVASVDDVEYEDLAVAITAANDNGATVTLLVDGLTVSAACQIDANGKEFNVADAYRKVDNGDGTYTVELKPAVLRINNMNGWGDLKVTIKSGETTVVDAQAMTKNGNTNVFYYEFDASYIDKEVSYFLTHSWYQTSTKTVTVTADTEAVNLHTTYLEPGTWDWTSATFGAWFFGGNGESDTMVTGVKVKDNFFEFEIPGTTYASVIFVRCNKNNATASWDTKWNQTSNLTLNNKCYCVDSWTQSDLNDTQWF